VINAFVEEDDEKEAPYGLVQFKKAKKPWAAQNHWAYEAI